MQTQQYSEQDIYSDKCAKNVCGVWRYTIHYKRIVQQPTKEENF